MENVREIPGTNGMYYIDISTKECRCWSYYSNNYLSNHPDKINNRIKWNIKYNGKMVGHNSSVWVAMTFPELVQNEWFEGAEIDHIDTDRNNNRPNNLRWVSRKENLNNALSKSHMSDAHKEKLYNRPDQSKWVIKLSLNNEILHFYPSTNQAERETGIKHNHISDCCNGKRKTAGDYVWKYAE